MPSHRPERVAEAIREVVSSAILFEVADPRVRGVTVLRVEITGDLRSAVVFVSLMGAENEQKLAMRGLQHAAGFLQSKVANRLQMRFTPQLSFKKDEGVKKSVEISRLIDEALASDREAAAARAGHAGHAADPVSPTASQIETEPDDDEADDDSGPDEADDD